ncbi:MAG: M28 family peptidase [archaeon]|nr:M28 family peptidase [archaeon]
MVTLLACVWLAAGKSSPTCSNYVGSIQTANLREHLLSLQAIADNNNNTRAVGTSGYNASVVYIVDTLKKFADCEISLQPFTISKWTSTQPPTFAQVSPSPQTFTDFSLIQNSGSGTATGTVASPSGDGIGCDSADWAGFPAGSIALVLRGTCDFATKAGNAQAAGATAVLISNTNNGAGFTGSMPTLQPFVVLGIAASIGNMLKGEGAPVVTVSASTTVVATPTQNVLCVTPQGDTTSQIVIGSHLDSVPAGPGINDNGSGTSVLLQLAIQASRNKISIKNQIIFAWWSGEESGLLGSTYFVSVANKANIALNINNDMLGSPNGIRQILNGANANEPIRPASTAIQRLYEDYFSANNLPYAMKDFNGRSDYGPFIAQNIPAGGLATGAEVIKNMTERSIYGGLANTAYDPCYHQPCDTIENINWTYLLQMGQASAFTLESLTGQDDLQAYLGGPIPKSAAPSDMQYSNDGPIYFR